MIAEAVKNASTGRTNEEETHPTSDIDENVLERVNKLDAELFPNFPIQVSIAYSNRLRSLTPEPTVTLCYTEVLTKSFLELIASLKNFDIGFNESSVFIDIGSGIGKTILLIALLNTFKRAIGIEINDLLYRKGLELIKNFNKKYRSPIDQTEMDFIRGDGTYINWDYGHLVYIQCSCFTDEMLERISKIANNLLPGSVIMTVARKLFDETYFDLVGITKVEYIHGIMPVYIYRKSSKSPSNHPDSIHIRLTEVLTRDIWK